MFRSKQFLSGSYLFFTTTGIYLLRPVRDSLGIANGIEQLPFFFSVTFLFILLLHIGFNRWPFGLIGRKSHLVQQIVVVFIPLIFFIFFPESQTRKPGNYLFFAWVSVLSLSSVSMVWDTITNYFSPQQAKEQFARIAFGATIGSIAGYLVSLWAGQYSLALALVAFSVAFLFSRMLGRIINERTPHEITPEQIHGYESTGLHFSPFLLGCLLFIYALISTLLYLEQAWMISAFQPREEFMRIFAQLGLLTNIVVLFLQLFVSSPVAARFGWRKVLAAIPLVLMTGMLLFMLYPTTILIAVIMAVHRCSSYVFLRPAREIWFAGLDKSQKSRLKNLLDTVVYRGGDVAGSWLFIVLINTGVTMYGVSVILIAIGLLWFLIIFQFKLNKTVVMRACQW